LAALIELGAGFHPDLTGRENVYLNSALLGLTRTQTEKYFDAIVDFSGIEPFIDTQVKFYSSGMYVRLAFAVAVHVDPDVLLVDEVLAVGDEPFQRKCMDRIRTFQSEGRSIVLVSHSLDQVAELCDRAIVLENGVVQIDGKPREALRHLRADFEQVWQEDRARENAHTRDDASAAEPGAKIVGVILEDRAGQRAQVIHPGEGMTVYVEVDVDSDVAMTDWSLGISIDSTLGQVVYGTNTRLLEKPMPPVLGKARFGLRLPALWLGEGRYSVTAALARSTGVEIHRVKDASSFSVETAGGSVGFIYVEPQIVLEG
jgi:ABC-2 type transport system ATP-binding protein